MNAVYHDKNLIFIGAMFREKLVFHHQAVNINWCKFIKVVSGTVLDVINAFIMTSL